MKKVLALVMFLVSCSALAGPSDWIGPTVDPTGCSLNQAITYQGPTNALGCVDGSTLGPAATGTIPSSGSSTGSIGSAGTYIPGNAASRIAVQRTTVVTDSSGNWSVTWATPFVSSTPTVNPIPLNPTATTPYNCNVVTRNSTTATGKCWQLTSQTVALISLTISLAPSNAPSSVNVMVIGAEPTQ